jgi:Tol biopolymer transport system component
VAPLSEQPGVNESNPLFSPDGRFILFERDSGDGNGTMLLLPREGGQPRAVAHGAEKSMSHWFPDSRRFLFQAARGARAEFLVGSIDGERPVPLLAEPYDTMHPAISPDGRYLAFAGNRDGEFDVFVKPLEGGEVRKVASTPERDGHPFFSADSRTVYFQPGHQNIWRVPLAGGEPQPVTSEPAHNLYLDAPRLAPDGRLLLSRCTFRGNVWVMEGLGKPEASP